MMCFSRRTRRAKGAKGGCDFFVGCVFCRMFFLNDVFCRMCFFVVCVFLNDVFLLDVFLSCVGEAKGAKVGCNFF